MTRIESIVWSIFTVKVIDYLFRFLLYCDRPSSNVLTMMILLPLWLTWWCAKHFTVQPPSCPFIQMTDTDVTFRPKYHSMDPVRLYVMILTSPLSLSLSRPWSELGVL